MRCEVVAIGTELLLGQIVDTNSSWIGEQLARVGIDSHYQTKVGDNHERIVAAIRLALSRSDAVICCGGLGPTQDDITRDVIAKVMGVEMRRDEEIAQRIRRMFEIRGRTMSLNNLRQADIPVGASPIAQMPGTAPGLVCPIGDKVIYAVPGVPREMKEMVLGTVLPDLRRRSGQSAVIRSRVLRTWGLSESGIDEMLTDRMAELDKLGNPTIAFQASGIDGIKVRLVAKTDDETTAKRLLDAEEILIRNIIGDAVFGVDEQSMELMVLNELDRRGMTLAAAESITGGILSTRLSGIDTAHRTFRGSSVLSAGREAAAGRNLPADQHAVSMAADIRKGFGTDVGIAAVAPEPDEGHAPGTIFMGLAIGNETHADKTVLPGDRARMREYAVISLLNALRLKLAT